MVGTYFRAYDFFFFFFFSFSILWVNVNDIELVWVHEMCAWWLVFFWSLPVNPSNFMLCKSIILSWALLTRCNYGFWRFQNGFWQIICKWKRQDDIARTTFFYYLFFFLIFFFFTTQFHLGCLKIFTMKKEILGTFAHWQLWYEWIKDAMALFDLLPHWRHADNFKQWNKF